MNKTKIEWCDMTWNPVTGCLHGCKYCYAEKITNRYGKLDDSSIMMKYSRGVELTNPLFYQDNNDEMRINPYPYKFFPTFHRYRLKEPIGKIKPHNIFVCSMADLFGDWVPDSWIEDVFESCEAAPQHKYMFLTKNPERFGKLNGKDHRYNWGFVKDNWWLGMTITGNGDIEKLKHLPYGHANTFVSFEPLMGWVDLEPYFPKPTTKWKCSYCGHLSDSYSLHCNHCSKKGGYSGSFRKQPINWVIIGAETGPRVAPPKPEWVQSIIDQCRAANVPVFMKGNLQKYWQGELIQEWPEELRT